MYESKAMTCQYGRELQTKQNTEDHEAESETELDPNLPQPHGSDMIWGKHSHYVLLRRQLSKLHKCKCCSNYREQYGGSLKKTKNRVTIWSTNPTLGFVFGKEK